MYGTDQQHGRPLTFEELLVDRNDRLEQVEGESTLPRVVPGRACISDVIASLQ